MVLRRGGWVVLKQMRGTGHLDWAVLDAWHQSAGFTGMSCGS